MSKNFLLGSMAMLTALVSYAQPQRDFTKSPSETRIPKTFGDSVAQAHSRRTLSKPFYIEASAFIGTMNGSTDLSESFNTRTMQFNSGVTIAANFTRYFAVRLEYTAGMCREADTLNFTDKLVKRNLSYRTNINEFAAAIEFYPFIVLNKRFHYYDPLLKPYVVVGAGFFTYNPEAYLDGQWYDLRSLRTEGQGFPTYPDRQVYGNRSKSYQVGLGAKYDFDKTFNIKVEFLYRFTETDYLDDINSTYINPQEFYRYLPNAQMAALAERLFKRQWRPGNTLSTGERRGSNLRNDGFYSFNLKFVFNIGRRVTRYSSIK